MKLTYLRKGLGLATALVALVTMSACGGSASDDNDQAAGDGELTKIVVGMQSVTPFVQVPLGVDKGLFKKHGLDVEVKIISEATTIPPAVLADQIDFAAWSYASFASLASKDLPLITVGPGDTAGTDLASDYTQLVTTKKSGIAATKDLAGKKIATNSLASLSEVQTRVALKNAGIDPDSVEIVPIPYANQGAALASGQVDAAQMAEPFLTKAKKDFDIVSLDALDVAIMPNLPVSTWFTSKKKVEQDPDVVRKFQLGLRDSSEYAQSHPDEVRAFLPEFSGVDESIVADMILPTWVTEADPAKVQTVVDKMYEFGAVDKKIDMSDYITDFPLKD
ncbi:ABC transporter substrate-binding protein [Aeromicrobium sp. P5_D10]